MGASHLLSSIPPIIPKFKNSCPHSTEENTEWSSKVLSDVLWGMTSSPCVSSYSFPSQARRGCDCYLLPRTAAHLLKSDSPQSFHGPAGIARNQLWQPGSARTTVLSTTDLQLQPLWVEGSSCQCFWETEGGFAARVHL